MTEAQQPNKRKPAIFNPAAKRDWLDLPVEVQRDFGHALHEAQEGVRSPSAKTLGEMGNADIIEFVERDRDGTYRAVITIAYPEVIFVLHAWQKKSTKGIATNKADLDLIKQRAAWADAVYHALKKEGKL